MPISPPHLSQMKANEAIKYFPYFHFFVLVIKTNAKCQRTRTDGRIVNQAIKAREFIAFVLINLNYPNMLTPRSPLFNPTGQLPLGQVSLKHPWEK